MSKSVKRQQQLAQLSSLLGGGIINRFGLQRDADGRWVFGPEWEFTTHQVDLLMEEHAAVTAMLDQWAADAPEGADFLVPGWGPARVSRQGEI